MKEEREKKNHVVESIAECVVRVDDQPDQQTLAREVRVQSVQSLCADGFVDTCFVWLVHLLVAEQLLLLTSYHGLHDLDWHLGPSLKTHRMLRKSRIEVLYWIMGTITLSGLLFACRRQRLPPRAPRSGERRPSTSLAAAAGSFASPCLQTLAWWFPLFCCLYSTSRAAQRLGPRTRAHSLSSSL